MDDQSINAIVAEIKPLLIGRAPGKIFQLSPLSMAIDFGLRETGFLLLSVEPSLPRMYFIKRRPRDLEKQNRAGEKIKELQRLASVGVPSRKALAAGVRQSRWRGARPKCVSLAIFWQRESGPPLNRKSGH